MTIQLSHANSIFRKHQFPIVLVCDRVNAPANIGSIFRGAESFGVQKIFFCGTEINIRSKRMLKTARSSHNNVIYEQHDTTTDVVDSLIKDGYELIGLEITQKSEPLQKSTFLKTQKIAVVIGDENQGISEEVLTKISKCRHITMYGNNSSMNVAMAMSIALYEITKQLSS